MKAQQIQEGLFFVRKSAWKSTDVFLNLQNRRVHGSGTTRGRHNNPVAQRKIHKFRRKAVFKRIWQKKAAASGIQKHIIDRHTSKRVLLIARNVEATPTVAGRKTEHMLMFVLRQRRVVIAH